MRPRSLAFFGLLTLAAGCSPLSAIPPFHLAETTEVLAKKEASITAVGGGGGAGLDGWGAGGGLRLRVGVGAHQEVGVEGTAMYVDTGARSRTPSPGSAPWIGNSLALGLKLSWKVAPLPWLALIAGAGATDTATGGALGGDFALVFSPGHALYGWFRPYGAVRGSFAVPVGRGLYEAGGPTGGLVVPFGISFEPTRWLRLFVEGGAVAVVSHGYDDTSSDDPNRSIVNDTHAGGYGALGVSFILGRKPRR
jgi:hypothetical protein